LIKYLQGDVNFDRTRLARIEWGFLPLLDPEFSLVAPTTLVNVIEADPSFFVGLLEKAYRPRKDRNKALEQLSENEQLMARNAYKLLDGLSRLPGSRADGTVDHDYLRNWIGNVREMAAQSDRSEVSDIMLGQLIARATYQKDNKWPSTELALLMEGLGTQDLFHGFVTAVFNARGVVSHDPADGGKHERQEAERYRELARETRTNSPKLAEAFLEVSRHYESEARREDQEAQRFRLGK
jgi:hypothetical protein